MIEALILNCPVCPSITAVDVGCALIDITRRTVSYPCDEVILAAAPTREATTL